MKKWIPAIAIVILFLNGCWTVSETESPTLRVGQNFDLNLRLEGFEYLLLQSSGAYTESTTASAYNYRSNAFATGSSTTSGRTYEYRPDTGFANAFADSFEEMGFNIRSDKPHLVLAARTGSGGFASEEPHFYYQDIPLFLVALATLGSTISCTRENDAQVIVYNLSGKRVAEYYSEKIYNAVSIGFPLANFANSKAYEWYGDREAVCFALIDCINQFTADLQQGRFDTAISNANTQYAKNSEENRGNKE